MIVTFSVSNFRSFREEQTLSMVASKRIADRLDQHTLPIPGTDERCLRAAVVYGANGAGKSNLIEALSYFRRIAIAPRPADAPGTARTPFRLGGSRTAPTSLDLQFVASGAMYRCGFRLDDRRILEEWLTERNGARERVLYERITKPDGEVVVDISGITKAGLPKLRALAQVGGPEDESFLATVRRNLKEADCGPTLAAVIAWLESGFEVIRPGEGGVPVSALTSKDPAFLTFAGSLLQAFGTGVDSLSVEKKDVSEAEFDAILPKERLVSARRRLLAEDADSVVIPLNSKSNIVLEKGPNESVQIATLRAVHQSSDEGHISWDLENESEGTLRLLELAPVLFEGTTQARTFVVDELDRSLHPVVLKQVLRFFLEHCGSPQRQLIVTTHESSLLDQELLRRDEIWFAEKDRQGETRLYPLTEFKVRNDLELRKGYLEGRFGAIPFLGRLEDLQEKKQPA